MSTVGKLNVIFGADISDLKAKFAQVSQQVSQVVNQIKNGESSVNKFGNSMSNIGGKVEGFGRSMHELGGQLTRSITFPLAAAAAAIGGFGKRAIDMAITLDSLEKGLTAMSGSAEQAAEEVAVLKDLALNTPGLDFQAAAKGALRLRATGLEAKLTADAIEALGKANAVAGGSTFQFSGAMLQLSQIISSGKLQGDELRIITEHIATFGKFIKDVFKATPREVADAIEEGELSMKEFLQAFVDWSNNLKIPADSVQNLLTKMRNEMDLALADIGKDFLPDLIKLIPEMMQAFKDATPAIKELFRTLSTVGVPVFREFIGAVTDLMKWFGDLSPATQRFIIRAMGISAIAGPVVSVTGAFIQLFGNLVKITGMGPRILSFTVMVAGAFRTMAVAAVTALGPVGIAIAAIIASLGILKSKLDEIKHHEAVRTQIEKNSEALAQWGFAIRDAAKRSETELLKLLQQFRQINAMITDREAARAIASLFNSQMRKFGNRQIDEYGNFIEKIKTEAEEAASVMPDLSGRIRDTGKAAGEATKNLDMYGRALAEAKRLGGKQPQWRAGGGIPENPLLSEEEQFAPLGIEFPIFDEETGKLIRNLKELEEHFAQTKASGDKFRETIHGIWNETKLLRAHSELAKLEVEHFIATGRMWTNEQRESIAGAIAQRDAVDKLKSTVSQAGSALALTTGLMVTFGGAVKETNIEVGKFTGELDQTVTKIGDASSQLEEFLPGLSEMNEEFRAMLEGSAWEFSDAWIKGIKRIKEEGFKGMLNAFKDTIEDMLLEFIRSRFYSFILDFFKNAFGYFGGGYGESHSGGEGQTQTQGIGNLQFSPLSGGSSMYGALHGSPDFNGSGFGGTNIQIINNSSQPVTGKVSRVDVKKGVKEVVLELFNTDGDIRTMVRSR